MTASSCLSSRLSMVPFSRERTMPPVSIKEYRRMKEQEEKGRSSADFDVRKIKTAPPARISSHKNPFIYQRQPSKPEIRPFSETRRSQSVPTSPSPGPTTAKPRTTKRTREKLQTEYFKDRSYMSDVYSWARTGEESSSEQIKGMELTETILNYKPERAKKGVYQKSENEDPLRSGLGYEGYMDCLLRGRRHRLTRKQWGITSDLTIKNEQPTLVPVNSMVRE